MALRVRKSKAIVPPGVVPSRAGRGSRSAEECPLNRCMELISGAWAPHVVWYLSAQPRRFGELRIDIPAVSARVLSQRLRELEGKGVITRTVVPTSPPSVEYELTELGRELMPALDAIARVGLRLADRPAVPKRARGTRRA
ncbi:MAG: helix-turn-helix transcriptional regulator [Kofleriaceae bacterium]|nr:helix-turn-helix transcriptional regulator [Kofleriaceae bacterium]